MQAGTGLVSQVGLYVGEVGPVTAFLVEGAQQVAVGFVAGSGDPGEALLQGGAFEVGIGTEYAQGGAACRRSEEHTSELQSRPHLVCRLLLEKKNNPFPLDPSTV